MEKEKKNWMNFWVRWVIHWGISCQFELFYKSKKHEVILGKQNIN
jgi:hypothetical protein